ncbi:MAG: rhodanese-like domain-containing protein, partial [Methanobacteriaceae archaeon]|nr:rhodanese-like domain-containing protein [Methanobacteriaceae archaeon]
SDRKKEHINGSYHIYTGEVLQKLDQIQKNKKIVVYCDSGYKSTLVASLLQKSNYKNVRSVLGSMGAWLKAGYPVNK